MSRSRSSAAPLVIVAGLIAGAYFLGGAGQVPQPTPHGPAVGVDLLAGFEQNPDRAAAKRDAHQLRVCLAAVAEIVAYDRGQAQPALATTRDVEDFRVAVRKYQLRGVWPNYAYPAVCEAIDRFLQQRVGDANRNLAEPDSSGRSGWDAWLDALRALEAECGRCEAAL